MQRRFLSTESERPPGRLGRLLRSLAVTAVAALLVAACGSTSSSSTSNSSGSASNAAATTSSSASTSSCMAQARQVVDAAKTPVATEAPSTPVDMKKLAGKTIYFVSLGSGYSLRLANGFTAAAHAAGLNPVVSSGATPQDWNTGIQQAVARHAAGIVIMAVDPGLVATSLAQAKSAGIPVISENSIPPAPTGVSATILVPTTIGKQVAAYAALDNNCKVKAVIPLDPSFVGLVAIANSMKAEFNRLCPSTCSAQNLAVNIATIATSAGPALQSTLQRDQSINAVMPTFDSLGLVMQPALAQSGSKAKLYGLDGDPANIALVRQGVQVSDYSYAPTEYQAYINLDALARAILKMPASPPAVQFQMFDKSNLPASASFDAMWPQLANYQTTFAKLWGLS